MNTIDKVLLEWSLKTDKGYPDLNSKEDMDLFESMFGIRLNEDEEKPQDSLLKRFEQKLNSASPNTTESALKIYSGLDENRKAEIDKHLDKYSIKGLKDNLNQVANIFSPFFNIEEKGVGRGELLPLLAIKDSKSGGTAEKDIIVNKEILEVKELDNSNKFRTGKTGSIRDTKLDANIQTLIKLIKNLDEIPEIEEERKELLDYYEKTYKFGSGKPDYFLKDIVNIVKKLRQMKFNNQDYVKIDGKRFAYTRTSANTITLGPEMEERAVTISKLKKHPYFTDLGELVDNFKEVKNRFLDSIHYLLLYPKGSHTPVGLFSTEEAKEKVHVYDVNAQNIRLRYGKEPRITLQKD